MSQQIVAGSLLILSFIVFAAGGILFMIRAIWKWPAGQTPAFLRWERGFVMAAVLVAVLGLTLLERMLETAGDTVWAPMGMVTFLIGAVLAIGTEAFFLARQEWLDAAIVVFVELAFLGQAVFGIALLQTRLLPAWVGWATVIWNLVWLFRLPILRPREIYYPWLHYVAPLLIGAALLLRR